MKKLEYIKEDVAIDAGYNDWEEFINDQPNHNVETVMDEVAKRYALEYGQALLQKASEEAMLEIDNEGYLEYQKEYMDHDANPITSPVYRVSKKHILNTKLDLI